MGSRGVAFVSPRHSLLALRRFMIHRILLGVLVNPPRFPILLETEYGAICSDPLGGSWFGRVAERSPLTLVDQYSLANGQITLFDEQIVERQRTEYFLERMSENIIVSVE